MIVFSFTEVIISLRYPTVAEHAYGESRRGCFENPSDTALPQNNIDCPDIIPVELEERDGLPNREAMLNPSPLVKYTRQTSVG